MVGFCAMYSRLLMAVDIGFVIRIVGEENRAEVKAATTCMRIGRRILTGAVGPLQSNAEYRFQFDIPQFTIDIAKFLTIWKLRLPGIYRDRSGFAQLIWDRIGSWRLGADEKSRRPPAWWSKEEVISLSQICLQRGHEDKRNKQEIGVMHSGLSLRASVHSFAFRLSLQCVKSILLRFVPPCNTWSSSCVPSVHGSSR